MKEKENNGKNEELRDSMDLSSSFRQALSATSSPMGRVVREGKKGILHSPMDSSSSSSLPNYSQFESNSLHSSASSFDNGRNYKEGNIKRVLSNSEFELVMNSSRQLEIQQELEDLEKMEDDENGEEKEKNVKIDIKATQVEEDQSSWGTKVGMNVLMGFIMFLIIMPNAFGFGGILTQHPKMKNFFPVVIQLSLLSNCIHQGIAVLRSRLIFNVANIQETNILFLALMANIVGDSIEDDQIVPTMFFVFAVTSIVMGIAYYVIGRMNLVSVIQYIPYPVMAGFLVAVGIYLIEASIAIMTDYPFENFEEMKHTFVSGLFLLALPGIFVGFIILFMERVSHHYMILPACLIIPFCLFWVVVGMRGISVDSLREKNFLFHEMESIPFTGVWNQWNWKKINFSVLPQLIPNFISMVILNILNTTLNISGLEYVLSRPIDSGKELEVAGIGNILCGCFGGFGGSITFSMTGLGAKNHNNRIMGMVTIIIGIALFLLNIPIIAYIPRFFFGAVLFYIGVEMTWSWLYKPFESIPFFEFSLLVTTALSLLILGNNVGLPVSLAISAIFFAFQYSRIKPIRKALHGIQLQSKVQRPYLQRKILSKHTQKIYMIQLQGYLFFGSTVQLLNYLQSKMISESEKIARTDRDNRNPGTWIKSKLMKFVAFKSKGYSSVSDTLEGEELTINRTDSFQEQIRKRAKKFSDKFSDFIDGKKETKEERKVSYLVLDFSMVHGLDSTAMSSFNKIVQMSASENITLLFCCMPPRIEKMFRKHHVISEKPGCKMKVFNELDLGLEWCENKIIRDRIKEAGGTVPQEISAQPLYDYQPSFTSLLASHLPDEVTEEQVVDFINQYFSKRRLANGELLFDFGDFDTSIYYIKSGQLNHLGINDETGQKIRILKATKGTFVGEVSKFLGIPHDTACEAEGPCSIYELKKESFERMKEEAPFFAYAVYTALLQSMCLSYQTFTLSTRALR